MKMEDSEKNVKKAEEVYWKFLHNASWLENSSYIYDMERKFSKAIKIYPIKEYQNWISSTQVGDKIYYCGGVPLDIPSGATFCVTVAPDLNITTSRLSDMIYPREGNSLAAIGKDYLFTVGVYKETPGVYPCEIYSIKENCWRLGPKPQESRYWPGLFVFQDRWIYIIGGGMNTHNNWIERIDFIDLEAGWIIINCCKGIPYEPYVHGQSVCAWDNQGKCLMFGGNYNQGRALLLNLAKSEVEEVLEIEEGINKEPFTVPICFKGEIYAHYAGNKFCKFDMKQKKWYYFNP